MLPFVLLPAFLVYCGPITAYEFQRKYHFLDLCSNRHRTLYLHTYPFNNRIRCEGVTNLDLEWTNQITWERTVICGARFR